MVRPRADDPRIRQPISCNVEITKFREHKMENQTSENENEHSSINIRHSVSIYASKTSGGATDDQRTLPLSFLFCASLKAEASSLGQSMFLSFMATESNTYAAEDGG